MTRIWQIALISVAILSFSDFSARAQTPIFGDFGAPAWSRMFKYLEQRFGTVAKDEMVLVLPTATNAAWDAPNPNIRLMEMYKWGDWQPSNAWQYSPNSGRRIADGYQYFLTAAFVASVDANGTAPPEAKNAARRAVEELQFTREEYNAVQSDARTAYDTYYAATPPSRRRSKSDFYKDQKWDKQIEAKKKILDEAASTYEIVSQAITDPDTQLLKNAQIRYLNPKQKILLPPVEEVLNNRDLWQPVYVSYIDKKITDFLNEYKIQTQNISESSTQSDYFEQHWRASVSVSFLGLFRAGGASAEQTRVENHVKSNATKIDINFENIDTFNVVRGDWYDESLISRFAPKLKRDAFNAVFGRNGQLELIPKTLLVGRGMTFSIYADSQSLDYLYEHFQAGADAGFFIGYWKIGGSGEYSTTKIQTKVTKFADHIEFADLSGRAQVLAVLCKQYAAGLPQPQLLSIANEAVRRDSMKRIETLWSSSPGAEILAKSFDPQTMKSLIEVQ